MGEVLRSRPVGHSHEQHLVLVRQCDRCARWIVLRGWVNHVTAFDTPRQARRAAKRLLHHLGSSPDPDPLCIDLTLEDNAVAIRLPPAKPADETVAA